MQAKSLCIVVAPAGGRFPPIRADTAFCATEPSADRLLPGSLANESTTGVAIVSIDEVWCRRDPLASTI